MAGIFKGNYTNKFEIGADEESLVPIAGGIANHDTSFDEDSDDQAYYDGNGGTEKIYKGITVAYSFTGNRKYGDEGQEFVRDRVFDQSNRDCFFRVTEPDGRVISGKATIGGIKISGGDANERPDFEFTVTFAGLPTDTKPTSK